jgi:hypothetical protein
MNEGVEAEENQRESRQNTPDALVEQGACLHQRSESGCCLLQLMVGIKYLIILILR